ncbi:MAG: amidase [Burkholderiaceae bacterium]
MNQVGKLSATELGKKIRQKELSVTEVVEAAFEQIEACQDYNAFVCTVQDDAMQAAARAQDQLMRGGDLPPLFGIPYSVKDVTNCQGVPTRYGSTALPSFTPTQDNLGVARARAAGAILLGKTTTPELAHKAFTFSPLSGLTLNPYSPDVTAGGSSGGAAVAVALGMGPIALGTDGGGSVRLPASCCGVVGLKPTIGSPPDPQAQDLFGATSHVGPLGRDVADVRLFYQVLQGGHYADPYGQSTLPAVGSCKDLSGLKIAWLPKCGNQELDVDVYKATRAAIGHMQDRGAIVEEISLDFAALEPAFFVLMECRIVRSLRDLDAHGLQQVDPSLLVHYERGLQHSGVSYLDALAARANSFRKVQEVLSRFDAIVSPTLSAPALPHDQDPDGVITINGRPTGKVRAEWYPYTLGFNMTGHPAVSIPCGLSAAGLPIGLQVAGRWYHETFLLDIAELIEQDIGFTPFLLRQ